MKLKCPNRCPQDSSSNESYFRKDGVYFRKSDSKTIQRYRCRSCGKSFSRATFSPCYRQKKRRVNEILFKLLSSGVSMRRAAIILNIHRITVKRKMHFLAKRARERHDFFLDSLTTNQVDHLQFDDLITTEHTKLKPLSISIAVDAKRRFILGAEVSVFLQNFLEKSMVGALTGTRRAFQSFLILVKKNATIKSDEHQNYPEFVHKFFPYGHYQRFKGTVVRQGEARPSFHDQSHLRHVEGKHQPPHPKNVVYDQRS